METPVRLVILAQPGHACDSLVAVLKTLRPAALFPLGPDDLPALGGALGAALSADLSPAVVLVDWVSLGADGAEALRLARRRWPQARLLALVETLRLGGPDAPRADLTLHRSVSTGDLLAAVRRLAGACGAYTPHPQPVPLPLVQ